MTRSPLEIVVADDEPLARRTLELLLAQDPDVRVVACCVNGDETVRAVREHAPDLLLLDVQMPGKDGFDVLEELGEDAAPRVVFVTAYDTYALRAFEVRAIDYLLKPFDDERFAKALARAKEVLAREPGSGMGPEVADLLVERAARRERPSSDPEGVLERLSIHREGKIELVGVADLIWIEAADQYVRLHTASGEHLMRESMSRLEERLDPERFLRVHRSAIVAYAAIRAYESTGAGCGRVQLSDGSWIPVSRARAARVRARIR